MSPLPAAGTRRPPDQVPAAGTGYRTNFLNFDFHSVTVVNRAAKLESQFTNKCSAVAEMGDRFAKIDMGRKVGAAMPLSGELDPHLTQSGHGPRPTSVPSAILIHSAVWPQ